jgi:hypothetical protein
VHTGICSICQVVLGLLFHLCRANSNFVNRVKERINKINPQSIVRHGTRKVFVFRELAPTPYIFLRNDTVKGPLQPPYDGPYKVIERGDKNFKILVNIKNTIVSIDRLKPAFIVPDEIEQKLNEPSTEPPGIILYPEARTYQNVVPEAHREENARGWYVTRSGRQVRFPNRYQASFKLVIKERRTLSLARGYCGDKHLCNRRLG